jgi:hypothetical protein
VIDAVRCSRAPAPARSSGPAAGFQRQPALLVFHAQRRAPGAYALAGLGDPRRGALLEPRRRPRRGRGAPHAPRQSQPRPAEDRAARALLGARAALRGRARGRARAPAGAARALRAAVARRAAPRARHGCALPALGRDAGARLHALADRSAWSVRPAGRRAGLDPARRPRALVACSSTTRTRRWSLAASAWRRRFRAGDPARGGGAALPSRARRQGPWARLRCARAATVSSTTTRRVRAAIELAAEIVDDPRSWSAGALAAPAGAGPVPPVAAYVGGWGEFGYHAQPRCCARAGRRRRPSCRLRRRSSTEARLALRLLGSDAATLLRAAPPAADEFAEPDVAARPRGGERAAAELPAARGAGAARPPAARSSPRRSSRRPPDAGREGAPRARQPHRQGPAPRAARREPARPRGEGRSASGPLPFVARFGTAA